MSQSEAPVDKEKLTMYLENITCTENLDDAIELSSDKLRAIVTLESPVDCKHFISVCYFLCTLAKYMDTLWGVYTIQQMSSKLPANVKH